MKNVLMMPDFKGWVIDEMAQNIKSVCSDQFNFTIRYNNMIAERDIRDYDVIYMMIPGYIPRDLSDYSKIITTLHGGPGTEGQADELNRRGRSDMKVSYVSTQVRDRVEQYGLKNMVYTPHGVNAIRFGEVSGTTLNESKIRAGWAGWINYLLNKQADHRRGFWVMHSQQELTYDLTIAGGLINTNKPQIDFFQNLFKNLHVDPYEATEMSNFYHKINIYLVPDKFAGGPMPVLEAGAMGIPSVASSCGLCCDIIEHGVNGWIANTYEEFKEGIIYMKEHLPQRQKMGMAMKNYIHKHRTWDAVKPRWVEFLTI
jgi:glycosyltransferase involved in cell wall biosynthesis